jgi:hypothetical protein
MSGLVVASDRNAWVRIRSRLRWRLLTLICAQLFQYSPLRRWWTNLRSCKMQLADNPKVPTLTLAWSYRQLLTSHWQTSYSKIWRSRPSWDSKTISSTHRQRSMTLRSRTKPCTQLMMRLEGSSRHSLIAPSFRRSLRCFNLWCIILKTLSRIKSRTGNKGFRIHRVPLISSNKCTQRQISHN